MFFKRGKKKFNCLLEKSFLSTISHLTYAMASLETLITRQEMITSILKWPPNCWFQTTHRNYPATFRKMNLFDYKVTYTDFLNVYLQHGYKNGKPEVPESALYAVRKKSVEWLIPVQMEVEYLKWNSFRLRSLKQRTGDETVSQGAWHHRLSEMPS